MCGDWGDIEGRDRPSIMVEWRGKGRLGRGKRQQKCRDQHVKIERCRLQTEMYICIYSKKPLQTDPKEEYLRERFVNTVESSANVSDVALPF